MNVLRASQHPDGLAPRILNLGQWRGHLLGQIRRTIVLTGDADVATLDRARSSATRACPTPGPGTRHGRVERPAAPRAVPAGRRSGDAEVSLFTTLTTFGTPRDITLDELAVEALFPADAETAAALAG